MGGGGERKKAIKEKKKKNKNKIKSINQSNYTQQPSINSFSYWKKILHNP